ncbi:Aste57867_8066 [Aphanomyces stellatus]|uniref:Aste57867_8066 protein n=1 Tax=Aphanomyces stellatus TaxID=120398 RepID=A0A485KJC0_9STRA|nr:hypothetical protein As57867_008036 [Aphanomyces stellatus]VFT84957.1 Aste57867_8066 [Aphanomyces stellatus]
MLCNCRPWPTHCLDRAAIAQLNLNTFSSHHIVNDDVFLDKRTTEEAQRTFTVKFREGDATSCRQDLDEAVRLYSHAMNLHEPRLDLPRHRLGCAAKRAKIYIKLSKPKLAAVYQGEIASPTGALSRLDMNSCAAGRVLEASFKRRSNAKGSPRSEKNMEVATLTHQLAVLQIELARYFICKQSPARCWWHFWAV